MTDTPVVLFVVTVGVAVRLQTRSGPRGLVSRTMFIVLIREIVRRGRILSTASCQSDTNYEASMGDARMHHHSMDASTLEMQKKAAG